MIERGGFGAEGAAPVVKCLFDAVSGQLPTPLAEPQQSDPLDPNSTQAGVIPPAGRQLLREDHPDRGAGLMATVTGALGRKPLSLLSRSSADRRAHVDWGLIVGVLLLVGGGMVAIYTATYQNRTIAGLDTLYFVKRQGLALGVGLVGMAIVMLIDYHKLREWSLVLYLGVLGMLAAVLVVARARNGVDAWFDVGPFQLQPSEFAKVVIVLVLAGYLAHERAGGDLTFPRFVTALGLVGHARRARRSSSPTWARRRRSSSSPWPCSSWPAATGATSPSSRRWPCSAPSC